MTLLADSEPMREDRPLIIGSHTFASRLFVGTGKYDDLGVMSEALEVSGTQCVTVAVRRLELGVPHGKSLLDYLDRERYAVMVQQRQTAKEIFREENTKLQAEEATLQTRQQEQQWQQQRERRQRHPSAA